MNKPEPTPKPTLTVAPRSTDLPLCTRPAPGRARPAQRRREVAPSNPTAEPTGRSWAVSGVKA